MKQTLLLACAIAFSSATSLLAQSSDDQSAAGETVRAFHRALQEGNGDAAMALLADDALILESGETQTKQEYGSGHLAGDIAFMKSLSVTHSDFKVKQESGFAWVTQTYRVKGNYKGREIDSQGAELMVLSETPAGWRIRAVHWSNHDLRRKVSPSPTAANP